MKNFLLDLWHDLREKRLAPVAVLLVVGLVAVPAVLLEGAPEMAPVKASPVAPAADVELPELKNLSVVAEAAARGGSTLSAFKAKDPFRPPAVVLAKKESSTSTATAPSAAPAAKGGSAGGSTGTGGGVTAPRVTPPRTTPKPPPTVQRAFTYVADLTFARNGRARRVFGMSRLGMLPSEDSPLLIFLGVTADGDNAVFLVDSALTARGEGSCAPAGDECATLTIGAGDEHEFADADGNTYGLRIDEIRKVALARASASGPTARTAAGPRRRFVPPVLADLLTVSGPAAGDSSAREGGR